MPRGTCFAPGIVPSRQRSRGSRMSIMTASPASSSRSISSFERPFMRVRASATISLTEIGSIDSCPFLQHTGGSLLSLQFFDDRVRYLRGPDSRWIIRARLEVVGNVLTLGDDLGDGPLQAIGGILLTKVAEHEHAGEHHRHRIDLVLARILGGAAVHRLEYRVLAANVRARRDTQTTNKTGRKIGNNIAVEVGQHQHIVLLRLLHQLHTHIIDDAILELDIMIFLSHLLSGSEKEAIGEFHDIGLMYGGHFATTIRARILKSELDDTTRRHHRNKFDADGRLIVKMGSCRASDRLKNLLLFRSASLKFNTGIKVFGILTNNNHIDIFIARTQALVGFGGAKISIEIEFFAQGHICAAGALADRSGNRAL